MVSTRSLKTLMVPVSTLPSRFQIPIKSRHPAASITPGTSTDELKKAEAKWEIKVIRSVIREIADPVRFEGLKDEVVKAAQGSKFKKLEDGSWLGVRPGPQKERLTITAKLEGKKISGLRLEHLSIEGTFCRIRRPSGDTVAVEAARAARRYLERRAELGLNCSPTASLVTDSEDRPIPSHRLPQYLRAARTVRLSLEANASLCSALLDARKAEAPGGFVQIGGQHVSG